MTVGYTCADKLSQFAVIYLIRVVYITRVINLCYITRVMLYQILPVGTTFDTAPRFNASVTYFRRFASTFNITISTTNIYIKLILNETFIPFNWMLN